MESPEPNYQTPNEAEIDRLNEKLEKLLGAMADISNMCIGEIAMGYKLDANAIGETIWGATGMTNQELNEYCGRAPNQ